MGSRSLTITEAAYARLADEKRPGESFTDVILRLTQPKAPRLSDLHRLIPRESAEALAEAVEARRKRDLAARSARPGRGWDA